jgi:hypothetical protein
VKRRFLLLLVLASPLVLGRLAAGCASQGLGQRCSVLNNSDDCALGLTCTSQSVLGGNSDICCLAPVQDNTIAACIPGGLGNTGGAGSTSAGIGGFGGLMGTGGTGGTGGSDAGTDAGDAGDGSMMMTPADGGDAGDAG